MKTKTIKQSVIFKASPKAVYAVIMDAKKHSAFSGSKVKMDAKVNGKFTAYDGYIEGKNLELIPGKKIVQAWRASDWEEGYYSIVEFTFTAVKNGTKMIFIHKGVPDDQYESIKQGWTDFYWVPMKEMIEEK